MGHIRFTHLKTRVVFLYLTLSENESQFSLENISADGVKKFYCEDKTGCSDSQSKGEKVNVK